MEIKIRRGQDNDYYWAEIEVCGDDSNGFYPFILQKDKQYVDIDNMRKSQLKEYINPTCDNMRDDEFYIGSNKIKLIGRSMVSIQEVIEDLIVRIKLNCWRFLQCKKAWSSDKDEIVKIN